MEIRKKKFKIGDKVKRVSGEHFGMTVGDIATVKSTGLFNFGLNEFEGTHDTNNFELYDIDWCKELSN